jgi:hypothetical protein
MLRQPAVSSEVPDAPDVSVVAVEERAGASRRSVLFVRSVALPTALRALAALRAGNRDAHITVLTNDDSARAIEASGHADEIVRYSPVRFGLFAAGLRRLAALRARRFDLVLVPYAGSSWLPFWNVGRFGLALGGGATRWLAAETAGASVDISGCEAVSLRAWSRTTTPGRRVRLALLALLKWPALLTATLLLLAGLALVTPVLFLFVWLTPTEQAHGN